MSYCVKERRGCVGWVDKYFNDCLCDTRDKLSFASGMLSLISWGVAEIPQIITNFRSKSSHGVSLLFLLTWILGDIFNLIGCLLEPATLPTQYYTALLYTTSTVILVLQCLYYDHVYSWWKSKKMDSNQPDYDIRKECKGKHCYDFSRMDMFLNLPSVKEALGVHTDFVSCSDSVKSAMMTDRMKDLEVGIPELLEDGIKVLICAGEYDLICNWLGNSRWVHAMKWSGQKNFGGSPAVPFLVNGSKAGEIQSYGPLTFLKVDNAGHMVPMDQPKASLKMLTRWMQGKLATK